MDDKGDLYDFEPKNQPEATLPDRLAERRERAIADFGAALQRGLSGGINEVRAGRAVPQ
jgi:hypothetical protein